MTDQVVPPALPQALSHGEKDGFKPAMAGQLPAGLPSSAPVAASAAQGRCPVDPRKLRPLPSVLGVKLTYDLRAKIADAAKRAGVTDSAWLRLRALETIGLESPVDAASGRRPRIAPEDQAALSGVVRDLGEATLAVRSGRINDGVAALERARAVVIPVVLGFEQSV